MECTEEEWRKFYLTRLTCARSKAEKNGILRPWVIREGLTNCKNCQVVSYLKPFLAKRLISTYLSDANEIFCPMNGFSGFMLGAAVSCGKKYIGQDLNAVQIDEAIAIRDFLLERKSILEEQVSLCQKDMFADVGTYDCLVCCPPYSLKEMCNFDQNGTCLDQNLSCNDWIDEVLKHYSCRKYLFVVDGEENTDYDNKIVEVLSNKSHFNENSEKVILIS